MTLDTFVRSLAEQLVAELAAPRTEDDLVAAVTW